MERDFGIQTLFANTYLDIKNATQFTPYVGFGLGMGFINTKSKVTIPGADFSANTGSKTVSNFAWNVGAGVGIALNQNWTVDAGYRFVGLGSVNSKSKNTEMLPEIPGLLVHGFNTKTKNLYQHQVALGLRYTF